MNNEGAAPRRRPFVMQSAGRPAFTRRPPGSHRAATGTWINDSLESADVIRAAGPAVLAAGLAGPAGVRSAFVPLLAAVTGEPMRGLELRVQAGDGRPQHR